MKFRDNRNALSQLLNVLEGIVPYDEATPAIKSWAQFYFYEAAQQILKVSGKEARREALKKVPEGLRPHVEKEVIRLWNYYKNNK